MTRSKVARRGSWPSPISALAVARQSKALDQPRLDGDLVYWIEGRANEGGRAAVVRANRDGSTTLLTPPPFNVRNRVHEYGGAAYTVANGVLYASDFADGRLYAFAKDEAPRALTENGPYRYADLVVDVGRNRLIAVREDHSDAGKEPRNTLVVIALSGSQAIVELAAGSDFYSSPAVSPDGSQLAWLSWNHPHMPWNGTELWCAQWPTDGELLAPVRIGDDPNDSFFQPSFSPAGVLFVVSDRSGWWNLYRVTTTGLHPVCPKHAEFGRPQWVMGMSTYGFLDSEHIVASYVSEGISHLARIDIVRGQFEEIATPYTDIDAIRVGPDVVVLLAGSARAPLQIVTLRRDLTDRRVLATSVQDQDLPDPACLSEPCAMHFASAAGRRAHAFFYAPQNAEYTLPSNELPPLLVISHGGPTAATSNVLKLAVQFWTSRGFAVLDVNYGGSSGFGRAYRDALKGQWGIVDVEDCIWGARHAAELGLVDRNRLAIRGNSAGGFTTLCALTFHDTFKAGASYYGVSDLAALDRDTHKFESHYTDYLLASQPAREKLYRERSPIHHLERITCPVIFFQGQDDKVVPPSQSEAMVEALRSRGLPVAYLAFSGEGHGFRRAENLQRTLEAELYFYCKVLDLEWLNAPIPVTIENL